jgi:hypothetical protein
MIKIDYNTLYIMSKFKSNQVQEEQERRIPEEEADEA